MLGYQWDGETQGVFQVAGERLWVDLTDLLRHRLGRRAAQGALSFVEPSVGQAVATLLDDPRLSVQAGGLAPRAVLRLLPRLAPLLLPVLRYLRDPDGRTARCLRP